MEHKDQKSWPFIDFEKWHLNRRDFIRISGITGLTLSLSNLTTKSLAQTTPESLLTYYPYRDWEDIYRNAWSWDKVVKGTHTAANCAGACAFDLYIKNGIVLREEQVANYPPPNSQTPDYNPRGCQKGVCYTAILGQRPLGRMISLIGFLVWFWMGKNWEKGDFLGQKVIGGRQGCRLHLQGRFF